MKLRVMILIVPLLGTACAQPAPSKPFIPAGRYERTIQEGELQRHWVLRVPQGYDGRRPLPLVVVLHGLGSTGAEAEIYTEFGAKADKERFIAAFPDGTVGFGKMQGWNAGFLSLGSMKADDVKFITDLIDTEERELQGDQKRVYVAGHSNGAFMANALGAKLSDRLAAIASVAGTVGVGTKTIPDPAVPLSAILIHGTADNMVAFDENATALLRGIGAQRSAQWWAGKLGATNPRQTKQGNATFDLWTGGKNRSEVELVTIAGGSHDWPGGFTRSGRETTSGVHAVDIIWDFFKSHPKR